MTHELILKEPKKIVELAKVLSSETRYKIVNMLLEKEMTISELAKAIEQTQANTSAQIKMIEKIGLMDNKYEPGDHGVKKICKTKVKRIILEISG
ncbi:MAG: ArsR/SmtB family transcription factor [Candidatus Heimdallarchaeaceae archaeon]